MQKYWRRWTIILLFFHYFMICTDRWVKLLFSYVNHKGIQLDSGALPSHLSHDAGRCQAGHVHGTGPASTRGRGPHRSQVCLGHVNLTQHMTFESANTTICKFAQTGFATNRLIANTASSKVQVAEVGCWFHACNVGAMAAHLAPTFCSFVHLCRLFLICWQGTSLSHQSMPP